MHIFCSGIPQLENLCSRQIAVRRYIGEGGLKYCVLKEWYVTRNAGMELNSSVIV
jgi:hypothetical protein